MFNNISDTRKALEKGSVVESENGVKYIIDKTAGTGGFSIMYIAHQENTSRYVALKELFPRHVDGNAIVERSEDGRLVIYDPLADNVEHDDTKEWRELSKYLYREVELTKKAAIVFNDDGGIDTQNNPDILQVTEPFRDIKGNYYVAVDTAQGEPLRDYISEGFVRDYSGKVLTNSRLGELLSIMESAAQILDKLHSDNHLLHLDLSPDNIYITKTFGGAMLKPHIIDYGSAYDLDNPSEEMFHQYTVNPFSPPEVAALAELNDQNCGYRVETFSDTYSIVSILFWALTERIWSTEMLFRNDWKTRFRNEYAPDLYGGSGSVLAEQLISFFEKGLASSPSNRFQSATQLCEKIRGLQKAVHDQGRLLSKISDDELVSYIVLDKYPMYQYKSASGNIDVLCLGSGVFVKRMILSMISCGQMLEPKSQHLHIHIVSAKSEIVFKEELLADAPLLEEYSNLVREGNDYEYITFFYECVPDLLQAGICEKVASAYRDCRYVIISLGSNNKNRDLGRAYARRMAEMSIEDDIFISYYVSEDAAKNQRSDVKQMDLPSNIRLKPFADTRSAYSKEIRSLAKRALKVNHLYEKVFNPRKALEDTAQSFSQSKYDQRSSCASALHLKYKVADILIRAGLKPSPNTNRGVIISKYMEALNEIHPALMELEHRRWMMFMISDGYRLPTMEQIASYSFTEDMDGAFNASFKGKLHKLHHCLVPCSCDGSSQLSRDKAFWDSFESYTDIDKTDYDPFDKMSLKAHLLAKRKSVSASNTINSILQAELPDLIMEKEQTLKSYADSETLQGDLVKLRELRNELHQTKRVMERLARSRIYKDEDERISLLELSFSEAGLSAPGCFRRLHNCLKIFIEFSKYNDFKDPDATIIDHLLWLLYADDEMTMIKVCGKTISDNITGPLILEPKKLIYFGTEHNAEIEQFLREHGNRGSIRFISPIFQNAEGIYQELNALCESLPGNCVIDITGSDELYTAAAVRHAASNKAAAIIRGCPDSQTIENIQGFVLAPVYGLNTKISSEEVYNLYGAAPIKGGDTNRYMLSLSEYAQRLWNFYKKYQADWERISAFFFTGPCRKGSSEFYVKDFPITSETKWLAFSKTIEKYKWEALELGEIFSRIADSGFIKDLRIDETSSFRNVNVSFMYPYNAPDTADSNRIGYKLKAFFTWQLIVGLSLKLNINVEGGTYAVDICSGQKVEIYNRTSYEFEDKRTPGAEKNFSYFSIIPTLEELRDMDFISDLEYEAEPGQVPVKLKFIYKNQAIKDCLATAGNVLELYAWHSAVQTHYFDDCRANFSFQWKENVKNELDLILTKGLTTLVVSCKTAKFNKEHLYEIKYLTDRFSLGSKAVILYSSTQAVDEEGHLTDDLAPVKARAKAMGVYLIDLNELGDKSLGEVLVEIAKGIYEVP